MAITSHCITQSQTRKALLSCPVSVLAHETPILYDHPPPEQPPIMLFKREKHGAPVRRDFSHMVQKCKKAVAESSSATAVVSVPNLRSKAPTHHQVFWLMQPGAAGDLPKRPARLPAFSWALAHNGRLSAQSRATANTATG